MAEVLLVYASTHGHTAKIAQRIARAVSAEGLKVDVRAVDEVGEADPTHYDGTIIAASLHEGRHQRAMVDWARHVSETERNSPDALGPNCRRAGC